MSYLNQLDKQINAKHISISDKRYNIKVLYSEAKEDTSPKGMLAIMLPSILIGFLLERSTHKNSVIGHVARLGVTATLNEVVHSLHFLSSFSAIFIFAQLKKRLLN